jgi:hypothetical protein
MISFHRSEKPIAKIIGGPYDKKVVHVHDQIDDSKKIGQSVLKFIKPDDFYQDRKNVKSTDLNILYKALQNNQEIQDPRLESQYLRGRAIIDKKVYKELKLDEGSFQQIANIDDEQTDILYIVAPQGAGKSTYTRKFTEQYHKQNPKNPVYLFSRKISDPAFDDLKYIVRIVLDDNFLEDNDPALKAEDFKDSLVIFDDVDVLEGEIRDVVKSLQDELCEIGRSLHVSVVVTSHLFCEGQKSKKILNESTGIVMFLNGPNYHIKRVLKEYLGLGNKEDMAKILSMPSRWVYISKKFPMYVMGERDLYLV